MRILRDTLVSVLNLEDDIKVVAQVAAGTDIVPAALAERPDLAVLDIDLPGLDGVTAASTSRTSADPGTTKSMPTASAASLDRSGNWATRGIVAAGRGIGLVGLTLAGLMLWVVFATAVTLAPLGIGLPVIPVTVRAMRRLETRVRRLVRCRHR
jgi:CheY-like chemotaxis protein